MVDSLRYLKSVGDQVRRSFVANKTILAFQEYMEAFFEAPRVHARDAAQFIRDCFDHYGTETIQRAPGSIRRFKLFDRPFDQTPGVQEGEGGAPVIGQEEVQNAIYRIARHSFVRAGRVHKLILLHGPNGSAKSSHRRRPPARRSRTTRARRKGALYRLNWIFPNERLVKGSIGFGEKLGVGGGGDLCAPRGRADRRAPRLRDEGPPALPRPARRAAAAAARAHQGRTPTSSSPPECSKASCATSAGRSTRRCSQSYNGDCAARCCGTCRSSASTSRAAT